MIRTRLTREEAEFVGIRRQRFAKRVEKMLASQTPYTDIDESLKAYTIQERQPYYRTLAGQAIGRPLTKEEEVHIITHFNGVDDAEVCVPMANASSHKRVEFFMDQGGYLNQLPNGAFEIGDRPLKCIVDVV